MYYFCFNILFLLQDTRGDLELGSCNDNLDNSKIEPTKAEAEAIARGLQVPDYHHIQFFSIYIMSSLLCIFVLF